MSQSVRERVSDKGKQRLDSGPIKINDGNETKETMMMMMLLRTKMAKMAMLLRRW